MTGFAMNDDPFGCNFVVLKCERNQKKNTVLNKFPSNLPAIPIYVRSGHNFENKLSKLATNHKSISVKICWIWFNFDMHHKMQSGKLLQLQIQADMIGETGMIECDAENILKNAMQRDHLRR